MDGYGGTKVSDELPPGCTAGVNFGDSMSCPWLSNDRIQEKADIFIVSAKLGWTLRHYSLSCIDYLSQGFLFRGDAILSHDGVDAEGLKLAAHLDLTAVAV